MIDRPRRAGASLGESSGASLQATSESSSESYWSCLVRALGSVEGGVREVFNT